jgi:hypothetical protein
MNRFFSVFKKSLTSPAYYVDILKAPFSFSLKYLLVYFFFYAVIGTTFLGITTVPSLSQFLTALPKRIEAIYPPELEIVVKNGIVSTNVNEPYALPLQTVEKAFTDKVLGLSTVAPVVNLLVIDTKGSVENFSNYQTMILLTQKNIAVVDKDNVLKMYSIDPTLTTTINRALVSTWVQAITPYLHYFTPLAIAAIFLSLLLFVPGFYQLYLLFFAFLLWLFSKAMKSSLSYSKSFQLSMHLVTITATLFGILKMVGISANIPLLQTFILLVFSYFVLTAINTQKTPSVL